MTQTLGLTRRAGFWLRSLAAALDLLIGGLPALLLAGFTDWLLAPNDPLDPRNDYLLPLVFCLATLGYTSFEVFAAATPGKMLLRLVIATPGGARADRWTLGLRWSTKYAWLTFYTAHLVVHDPLTELTSTLMFWLVALGCLQALDEHKRTWHDEWAHTAVFRRPRAPAAAGA
jgi:hypothetical protein